MLNGHPTTNTHQNAATPRASQRVSLRTLYPLTREDHPDCIGARDASRLYGISGGRGAYA